MPPLCCSGHLRGRAPGPKGPSPQEALRTFPNLLSCYVPVQSGNRPCRRQPLCHCAGDVLAGVAGLKERPEPELEEIQRLAEPLQGAGNSAVRQLRYFSVLFGAYGLPGGTG